MLVEAIEHGQHLFRLGEAGRAGLAEEAGHQRFHL